VPPHRRERIRESVFTALDRIESLMLVTTTLVTLLTILLTAGRYAADEEDPTRLLLTLALSVTFAGAVSEAIVYALEDAYHEASQRRSYQRLRGSSHEDARKLVADVVEHELGVTLPHEELDRLTAAALAEGNWRPLPEVDLDRSNLRESLASVMYSLGALAPVVIPLLLIEAWEVARWVSIGVAVTTLYVVGVVWGRRDDLPPVLCGSILLGVGLALVGSSLLFEALV
jgi:hypothetical protein